MRTFKPSMSNMTHIKHQPRQSQIDEDQENECADATAANEADQSATANATAAEDQRSGADQPDESSSHHMQPLLQPNTRNVYFTPNPDELTGDFVKTSLLKTQFGFGFTIIGANETNDDFLQIKHIVPEGAAARDGKILQGDVLVYVNNECVLGYTHQNVVEIFQSIPVGQLVELTVCRGYPLSIDPNDPNIEIMSLPAINNNNNNSNNTSNNNSNMQTTTACVDELAASINNSFNNQKQQQIAAAASILAAAAAAAAEGSGSDEQQENSYDEYYCEEYEELYAPIVKGPKGFGFTIADDSQMNHQKVKQIIDHERCVNLRENDILLEINGYDLKNLSHNQVVELLKECVKGQETAIKLKRRKYQIVLPQPPSSSSLNTNLPTSGPASDIKSKLSIFSSFFFQFIFAIHHVSSFKIKSFGIFVSEKKIQ
jgi:C-terminal processing protease CtpA/Prc